MSGLPSQWTWTQLDRPCERIQYGYTASSSIQAHGPRYLRITDIQNGGIDWSSVPRTEAAPGQDAFQLQKGDIVFARSGATVGKSFLIADEPNNTIYASYLIRVVPNPRVLAPEFAAFFFKSDDYWRQISAGASGTGQPNFNGSKLAQLQLPLPPLAEQRRIVAKLDALTARTARARADLDRIPALTAHYKQAVLDSAFRGELTKRWRGVCEEVAFSADEVHSLRQRRVTYESGRRGSRLSEMPALHLPGELSGLPPTWAAGCVGDVADLRVGYAFKSAWFTDSGVPAIRGANVGVGAIERGDLKHLTPERASEFADYRLAEGDILLAMDRPLIAAGLKIAQVTAAEAGALLVQRVASPVLTPLVDQNFMWWLLHSQHYLGQIERHATGSDLPHVSGNDILTTFLPLPPMREQREIAMRIDAAFSEIDRLTADAAAARRLLARLDQAILAKAFRGDLVPQDPADEPAGVLLESIRAERTAAPKSRRGRRAAA